MKNLDKEEFRVKLEEINHLVEQKDYKGAMNVVDSIDWRRVKNVRTLCVVGEIYAANKRYEESKEIFLLAYHRATIGKNILYRLIEVSLKMGQISEATEFFDEYREVAGSDNSQYILRYKIARAKNASLNEQIRILEEYKEKEFTERWSYELAKLYYKAGDKQKCLDLCNEMILWFNDGTYVMKALDLKQRMGVLTGEEKEKYEQRFIPKLIPPEKAQEIRESKETEAVTEPEEYPDIENFSPEPDGMLGRARALRAINDDVVGYIRISNTYIDYPVVQYDGENLDENGNAYYMDKDIYGNYLDSGTIWITVIISDRIKANSRRILCFTVIICSMAQNLLRFIITGRTIRFMMIIL